MADKAKSSALDTSDVSSVDTSDDEVQVVAVKTRTTQKVADPNMEEEAEEEPEEEEEAQEGEEEEEEGSEDEGGDLFEIERIVSHKKRNNEMLYKISWKGYDASQDSWEPASSLTSQGCEDVISAYWEEKKEKEKREREEREREAREAEEFHQRRQEESKHWGGILETIDLDTVDESTRKEILNLYVHDRVITDTEKALMEINSLNSPASTARLTRAQLRTLQETREKSTSSSSTRKQDDSAREGTSSASSATKAKTGKRKQPQMAGRARGGLGDTKLDNDFITAGDSSEDEREPQRKKSKRRVEISSSDSDSDNDSRSSKKVPKKEQVSVKKRPRGTDSDESKETLKPRPSESREKQAMSSLKAASLKAQEKLAERNKQLAASGRSVDSRPKPESSIPKVPSSMSAVSSKEALRNYMIPKKKPMGLSKKEPVRLNVTRTNAHPAPPGDLLETILNQQAVTVTETPVAAPLGTASGSKNAGGNSAMKPSTSSAPPSEPLRITSIRERTGKRISHDQRIQEDAPTGRRRLQHQVPNRVTTTDINTTFKNMEEAISKSENFVLTQEQFIREVLALNMDNVVKGFRNTANKFDLDYRDEKGNSLLHLVVAKTCTPAHATDDLIRVLADNGANLLSKNNRGFTPLQLAVKLNKVCNVRRLIGAGSPINVMDQMHRNALDIAIEHKVELEIVQELLYAGANVSQRCLAKLNSPEVEKEVKRSVIAEIKGHLAMLKKLSEKRQDVIRDIPILDPAVSPMFITSLCDPAENTYSFDIASPALDDSETYLVTCMLVDSAPVFEAVSKDNLSYFARFWGWSPVEQVTINGEVCKPVTPGSHHFLFGANLTRRSILSIRLKEEYLKRPLFVVTQVIKVQSPPSGEIVAPSNREDEDFVDLTTP